MIQYFCDICGKEITNPRIYHIPYNEDRSLITGKIGDCYIGIQEIQLCRRCALHLADGIEPILKRLRDCMSGYNVFH